MSAVGLVGALAWLAQPSVRAVRRPLPAIADHAPAEEPETPPVAAARS